MIHDLLFFIFKYPVIIHVLDANWNPTMRIILLSLVFLSLLSSGCSWIKFPGVHKIDIQQGNILDQEMVDKLQLGMTKAQVKFVLGTPLIADTFNQNRWDYPFRRLSAAGVETKEDVVVYFDDQGLLKELVGNYTLTEAQKN